MQRTNLLPLPLSFRDVNEKIIPAAMALLPLRMDTPRARVMMLANGGQESDYRVRDQIDRNGADVQGPALGLWQFERLGGVRGVMAHASTQIAAKAVCAKRNVEWDFRKVWTALEFDDVLAAAFARLFLWTDSRPLPMIGDEESAWETYIRVWRPGKPHRERWGPNYAAALAVVSP